MSNNDGAYKLLQKYGITVPPSRGEAGADGGCLYVGRWEDEDYRFIVPFMTVNAPRCSTKELDQKMAQEWNRAIIGSERYRYLGRLADYAGRIGATGAVGPIKSDADSPAGVADDMVKWLCDTISLSLDEANIPQELRDLAKYGPVIQPGFTARALVPPDSRPYIELADQSREIKEWSEWVDRWAYLIMPFMKNIASSGIMDNYKKGHAELQRIRAESKKTADPDVWVEAELRSLTSDVEPTATPMPQKEEAEAVWAEAVSSAISAGPAEVDRSGLSDEEREKAEHCENVTRQSLAAEPMPAQIPRSAHSADAQPVEEAEESRQENVLDTLMQDHGPLVNTKSAFDGGTLVAEKGQRVPASAPSPESEQNVMYTIIREIYGDEVLALYKKLNALRGKNRDSMTKKERDAIERQIEIFNDELMDLTDIKNAFSAGFIKEQKQIGEQWEARLITPDNCQKYAALMIAIEKAPPAERANLAEAFYVQIAEDADMPQKVIRVMSLEGQVPEGNLAGGVATGSKVLMAELDHKIPTISWKKLISSFFHEQGHELMYKLFTDDSLSAYPEDVAKLRHANRNYVRAFTDELWYRRNYSEQHGDLFRKFGEAAYEKWAEYRRKK